MSEVRAAPSAARACHAREPRPAEVPALLRARPRPTLAPSRSSAADPLHVRLAACAVLRRVLAPYSCSSRARVRACRVRDACMRRCTACVLTCYHHRRHDMAYLYRRFVVEYVASIQVLDYYRSTGTVPVSTGTCSCTCCAVLYCQRQRSGRGSSLATIDKKLPICVIYNNATYTVQ